jgi:hypothetical protein
MPVTDFGIFFVALLKYTHQSCPLVREQSARTLSEDMSLRLH